MKAYIYVYNEFAQFESVILSYLLKGSKHEVITVGASKDYVTSTEGIKVVVDQTISQVDVNDVDLFIIPGGNSYTAMGNQELQKLIGELNKEGKLMGAICHGPVLMAEAGVLEGKQFTSNVTESEDQFGLFKGTYIKEDVVVDGNFITATGNAYVEFAFEVARKIELMDQASLDSYYRFFKNAKEPITIG